MAALKNQRYELFAQALMKGLPASRAYIEAGYKPSEGNAARLKANEKVQERLAELRGRAATAAVVDKAWVLERLKENVERAMQMEPVRDAEGEPTGVCRYEGNVANGALKLLGLDLGMFTQKVELNAGEAALAEGLSRAQKALAAKRAREGSK